MIYKPVFAGGKTGGGGQTLDNKIKSSIAEGVSVFLAMFDMPDVAKVFCPDAPELPGDPRAIPVQARAAMRAAKEAQERARADSARRRGTNRRAATSAPAL